MVRRSLASGALGEECSRQQGQQVPRPWGAEGSPEASEKHSKRWARAWGALRTPGVWFLATHRTVAGKLRAVLDSIQLISKGSSGCTWLQRGQQGGLRGGSCRCLGDPQAVGVKGGYRLGLAFYIRLSSVFQVEKIPAGP